ncbi:MAG: DUF5916 domain-containing protein [Vicinamibacterales bacterium]
MDGLFVKLCRPRAALLLGFALAVSGSPAASQARLQSSHEELVRELEARSWDVSAARVQGAVRLDGRLDEPSWENALPVTDFYQGERNEGQPASERTEVRVLYDETALYVGFRCFDRSPGLRARAMVWDDPRSEADDLVSIMLDSYHGHRTGIQFVTNANGLTDDLFQNGETTETRNDNFNAVWESHGSRVPGGFEVEVRIPFKSLRFEPREPGEEVVFGIGFKRNIPRRNEEAYWPFVSNDSTWYRPAELGHLRGLRGIQPGRSVEVRPGVLAGRTSDLVNETNDTRKEGSMDVKWGVTSGLTADFTVNTDFAQEEADIQQVNFTRFSLFFPEKRQFFLEGEQMFQFGLAKEADLVFTRRIGLSEAGEAVPIAFGARVSGREGAYSLGAMNIQTRRSGENSPQNFTVVRLRRDLFARSNVGALFTNLQEQGGAFNRVFGADLNLFLKKVWSFQAFAARLEDSRNDGGSLAALGSFAYSSDRFGASYRFLDLRDNFDPGVGFVRRPGSRDHRGALRYSYRPRWERIRQLHFTTALSYITDQRNVVETRERSGEFQAVLESGDAIGVSFTNHLEAIDRPFVLRRDAVIPAGSYPFNTMLARLDTFKRRHLKMSVGFETGGFWNGTRNTGTISADWRLWRHLGFSTSHQVHWVRLPGLEFTTQLVSTSILVAFSNDVSLQPLIQYNQDTRQLSTNLRFKWMIEPGSDFFVVYNELDDAAGRLSLSPRNRSIVVKLSYLFAF